MILIFEMFCMYVVHPSAYPVSGYYRKSALGLSKVFMPDSSLTQPSVLVGLGTGYIGYIGSHMKGLA